MIYVDALTNVTFILFIVFLLSLFIFSRSHIGKMINGKDLSLTLLGSNKKDKRYVFKKMYINTSDGVFKNTSLVINSDGVFLFFYVSERGMLYGREAEDEWYSAQFRSEKPSYYFENPTKKVKYLMKILNTELELKKIYPFVVFLDGRLNNVHTETYTIYPMDIRNSFKLYHSDEIVYTIDELNELNNKIKEYNNKNKVLYKESKIKKTE